MSGAKSLAMVPICRAIVAFPAVPAPIALIAARIACRLLDSLAHHSGKAKLGFAMRHGLRQTRLRIAATSRVRARNGANLTLGASQRTSRDRQNRVLIVLLAANSLIPAKFTGSLRSLGSIDWSLLVEFLNRKHESLDDDEAAHGLL